MGNDVSNFFLHSLHTRSFSPSLNDATITLVPKKTTPVFVNDLRPIALCNVTYKIMAKMIANKLKTLLDVTVDDT